ncbi:RNA polymerase III subunit RPC82-domain-containing protein [Choanephora cucurbitarum]|nr:RNA polymerase III subunit RPC82-domain-containing protein [Choanephora cucurbitarum]
MSRIMRVTEEHYGKTGSALCQLLLLYGRVKLSQVQSWAKVKGIKDKDESDYVRTFTRMALDQFVIAVLPQHSRSIVDQRLEAEEQETAKYTLITAKDQKKIKQQIQSQMEAITKPVEMIGMKRKAEELWTEPKRLALESNETDDKRKKEAMYQIDSEVYFMLNYDKYNIYFRNLMMTDMATSRINKTAGIILKAFFRHGKDKMKNIKDDYSPAATVSHIANLLEPETFRRGDIVIQADRQAPSVLQVVEGYFQLLRVDRFLALRDELGANQYAVDFKKLRQMIKQEILEGLITDRFGQASCRLVRILLSKGKLDEQQLQRLSMLPLKDVRQKLNQLILHHIISIQEIPRSADKYFHLVYIDLEKCFNELLMNVYQTITHLQQRKIEELQRRTRLLDKLSRQDVMENMALLNEIDKVELSKMEKVIERLETSKDRLDQMIMILKDV